MIKILIRDVPTIHTLLDGDKVPRSTSPDLLLLPAEGLPQSRGGSFGTDILTRRGAEANWLAGLRLGSFFTVLRGRDFDIRYERAALTLSRLSIDAAF